MSFKTAEVTLSAAVATNGTISVAYPAGTDSGTFIGTHAHKMWAAGHQKMYEAPSGFTVSFGTSNITVTYKGTTSLPEGSRVNFQFDTLGNDATGLDTAVEGVDNVRVLTPVVINLGAPDTLDADGVCASAVITEAAGGTIGGALASGGVATFDVPRNVIVTSAADDSGVAFTITGTDAYGEVLVETIVGANAGAAAGKKAFKTVTGVAVDGDTAGAVTIGTGDVLGLPVELPQKGLVVKEMEDGVAATAGTLVAAVTSAATATTGDVRGTYDPNSACNGSKAFSLLAFLPDPDSRGVDQYAG